MARKKNHHTAAAARAREGRARIRRAQAEDLPIRTQSPISIHGSDSELSAGSRTRGTSRSSQTEICTAEVSPDENVPIDVLGVPERLRDQMEDVDTGLEDAADESDGDSVYELEGDELLAALKIQGKVTYKDLLRAKDGATWSKAEEDLKGVRTGRAARTQRERKKVVQVKANKAKVLRES